MVSLYQCCKYILFTNLIAFPCLSIVDAAFEPRESILIGVYDSFIGGTYGRVIGKLMVDLFGVHTEGQWAWMDPGAFALIGAASFFGGVSRLTMSLTVIMVREINSNNASSRSCVFSLYIPEDLTRKLDRVFQNFQWKNLTVLD